MNAWMTAAIACAFAWTGSALAQTEGEAEQPASPADTAPQPPAEGDAPGPEEDATEEPEDDEGMPSLDELLGLEEEEAGRDDSAEDPSQRALEQALSGEQIGDAFVQAVDLMGGVAERLQTQKDTGMQTQRLQEDILRRLDQLISSLEQQQQQQSSSSSSSSSQRNQQQPNQPQQQQQQQQSQGTESNENVDAPELQEGPLRPNLEPVTAAWGNLPARVRDQLMQGVDDRFSSLYERMTEAYYKRLAEEASRE